MQELYSYLSQHPIVYIAKDVERILGLPLDTDGYYSISNNSTLAKSLQINSPKHLLLEQGTDLSSRQLLLTKDSIAFIKAIPGASVLVFKNNGQIEKICKSNKWPLLNPSAAVSSQAEEKVSQINWLGKLEHYLPRYDVKATKDVLWKGERFILQFNHAHTGIGTALIESEDDLKEIQSVFPNRPARCSDFIPGAVYTNNNVVTPFTTLIGNISYQITGLPPFTDNPFATIGNDWALAKKLLTTEAVAAYHTMVQEIGDLFRSHGWKGLFGVDVVVDDRDGSVRLLEINARQPASTAFESELQLHQRKQGVQGATIFEAHLAALLDLPMQDVTLIPLTEGAQLVQRVTRYKKKIDEDFIEKAKSLDFRILEMNRSKLGKELLIIQSKQGMMAHHNLFNEHTNQLI